MNDPVRDFLIRTANGNLTEIDAIERHAQPPKLPVDTHPDDPIAHKMNAIDDVLSLSPGERATYERRSFGEALVRDVCGETPSEPPASPAKPPPAVSATIASVIRTELYTPAEVASITRDAVFPPSMRAADVAIYREMYRTSPENAERYRECFARDRLTAAVVSAVTSARAQEDAAAVRYAAPEARLKFADAIKRRAIGSTFANINASAREAEFIASTDTVDSYGEVVEQIWRLDRYLKNPVVLFAHESKKLPIGRAESIAVENGRLVTRIRFAQLNPQAELVWNAVQEGMIRAVSVGFRPGKVRIERRGLEEVVVLSDNELYEISVTPIGANPDALAM